MKLVGSRDQQVQDFFYDQSGTIATGGTPQLVLPVHPSRSVLMLQNISDTAMYAQIGSALATCAITSGVVSSVAVKNAGFNFTLPPVVRFFGGGTLANSSYLGRGSPGAISPSNPAQAHAVMTGSGANKSVSSIVIDNGGSGYVSPPMVFLFNSDLDPNGCADPSLNSGNGILLTSGGGTFYMNGTACPTDSVAIFCATTGKAFTCKYMT